MALSLLNIVTSFAIALDLSASKIKMHRAPPAPMARNTNADMTFDAVMAVTLFDSHELDDLRVLGSHFLIRTSIWKNE